MKHSNPIIENSMKEMCCMFVENVFNNMHCAPSNNCENIVHCDYLYIDIQLYEQNLWHSFSHNAVYYIEYGYK